MPYDSAGNLTLPTGSMATTGQTILASQHNLPINDLASAASQVLLKDGRAPMQGALNMSTYRITNLGDGVADTDAATVGQIADAIAGQVTAAPSKTTPIDADSVPIIDSAGANSLKRVTWANIKATLKTYFDTLYAAVVHTHSMVDAATYIIEAPTAGDYRIPNLPFAGTVNSVTTRTATGTATLTMKVNSTALGGTANSASTSEQEQAHTTTNTWVVGDDWVFTVASPSGITRLSITVKFTRTV